MKVSYHRKNSGGVTLAKTRVFHERCGRLGAVTPGHLQATSTRASRGWQDSVWQDSVWPALLLVGLTAFIYIGSAGAPALLDDIDAMYAEIAREMNARGDWITPYANGIRYFEKPPLFYWLMSLSYAVMGVANEFTARLPIALAVTALVGVTFKIGKLLFGARAGFFGGLALATSVGTFLFTRGVLVDAVLTLLVTLFFYAFVRWERAANKTSPLLWMYAFAGAAVLVKGAIGVFFPAAGAVLTLALTGRHREIRQLISIKGILLFLAICAPWHILMELHNPGFLWYYVVNEHILRFLGLRQPMDYGRLPLLPFWLLHLVWLFPWSFYLLTLAWPDNFRRAMRSHGTKLVLPLVWAGTVLLFFSFSSSRIEYYTFPALPALALLAGAQCAMCWDRGQRWAGLGIAIAGGAIAAAFFAVLAVDPANLAATFKAFDDDPDRISHFSPFFEITGDTIEALRTPLVLAATGLGLILPWHAWMTSDRARAAVLVAGMLTLFAATDMGFSMFSPHLTTKPLADEIRRRLTAGSTIVIEGDYEYASSVGFYTGLPVLIHGGRSPNLEYGAAYPDASPLFVDSDELQRRWSDASHRVFLITTEDKQAELANMLPLRRHVIARQKNKILLSNMVGEDVPGHDWVAEPTAPQWRESSTGLPKTEVP